MLKVNLPPLLSPLSAPPTQARLGVIAASMETASPRVLKQSISLLYAEFKQKSTKNSYLILLSSKDWLKHHRKSEKLSITDEK